MGVRVVFVGVRCGPRLPQRRGRLPLSRRAFGRPHARLPAHPHDRARALDPRPPQLESIVAAGPHVFVSLQAEVPPQAELKIGGVGGFMPYKAVVELIAASQTP